MVDCKTVPLQVPAHAEVVIEGWLEPGEMLPEGPFGDHTGFYTPQEPFPALTIDCVTMRKRPLLQSIVVGRPPTEDGPLGRATERFFLPLLKIIVPDIVDYHLPEAGGFHNCAIVSIDKKYPKHAQKVMHAIWGAHMMSLTKLIVVVDADCDVHDLHEVAWRALGNTDYARDLTVVEGPVDHLDHASYQQFWGGKAGIDATQKLPEEGYTRDGGWPEMVDVRPGDGGEGRPPLEGVRPVSAAEAASRPRARSRAGRVKAFLRLVMIEHSVFALPFAYIAALTAMFQLRRQRPLGAAAARHRRHGRACARSRWPRTGSSTARSTPATRAPRSRELVTGAVSVRSAWTGALVAVVVFLGRGGPAQPAVPGARADRRRPDGRLSVRQAVHRLPARHPRPRAGDGPDRRLARGHRRAGPGTR